MFQVSTFLISSSSIFSLEYKNNESKIVEWEGGIHLMGLSFVTNFIVDKKGVREVTLYYICTQKHSESPFSMCLYGIFFMA